MAIFIEVSGKGARQRPHPFSDIWNGNWKSGSQELSLPWAQVPCKCRGTFARGQRDSNVTRQTGQLKRDNIRSSAVVKLFSNYS